VLPLTRGYIAEREEALRRRANASEETPIPMRSPAA
jgi:hypothetical protein